MSSIQNKQRVFTTKKNTITKLCDINKSSLCYSKWNLAGASRSLLTLVSILLACGIFYVYEINLLATKGYEIREAENRVKELAQDSRQLKIREVELRSMYTIEKSMNNFNLVSPSNVSYIEIDGPVAMIK